MEHEEPAAASREANPSSVASCALKHYHTILKSPGKPKQDEEWTVYAALVAHQQNDDSYWVVTCATGSKCTTTGPEGWIIRDGHAEVMCRRGLVRELWQEVLGTASTPSDRRLLDKAPSRENTFHLRTNLSLCLYVSDAPCGDASIYPFQYKEVQFTGAKKIVDGSGVREPEEQDVGVLRTKSGRSNLPAHLRSSSMSCSDKLLRWCLLGLQGEGPLLARLDGVRIRPTLICVSRDPRAASVEEQQRALQRALVNRVEAITSELLGRSDLTEKQKSYLNDIQAHSISVHVVEEVFSQGKAQMEFRIRNEQEAFAQEETNQIESETTTGPLDLDGKNKRKWTNNDDGKKNIKRQRKTCVKNSPCGFSLNWQQSCSPQTEILVGARGVRQGKKPKSNADFRALASRLSRARLLALAKGRGSYREWKSQSGDDLRVLILSSSALQGWLVGTSDFSLEEAENI